MIAQSQARGERESGPLNVSRTRTAAARADDRGMGRLPPGEMGYLPFGEMLEYQEQPIRFLWRRCERYGRIFKTHLGVPTMVMVGPEANRFIHRDRRDAFLMKPDWPPYLRQMIGDEAMPLQDGEPFVRLRTLVRTRVFV